MLIGSQIREARALLGWSQADLSLNTFLTLSVVEAIEEHGSNSMMFNAQSGAIRRVCERAGVEFSSHGRPEARLRASNP